MKAKFLKIAGVKSEKEFYKKYPTEASFFKAHPEAKKQVKKANIGSYIGGEQDQSAEYKSYYDYANKVPLRVLGKTQEQLTAEKPQQQSSGAGGGGFNLGMDSLQGLMGLFGGGGGGGSKGGGATYSPKSEFLDGSAKKINFKSSALKLRNGETIKKAKGGFDWGTLGTQGLPIVGDILGGIQMLRDTKTQRKLLEQSKKISDVAAQAAASTPERTPRRYVRPEDSIVSPNERFVPGGTGTDILAEYGASIGGNPTEIQNMYDPGDIYSNLGYEPLSESDIVKQYRSGGHIPQAGFGSFMAGGGGSAISSVLSSGFSQSAGGGAGSKIGGGVGKGLGMIFGPAGSAIGEAAGTLLGGVIGAATDVKNVKQEGSNRRQLQNNLQNMAMQDSIRGTLGNYSSFVKNGGNIPSAENGWVSHDWQPQTITHFGEHSMKDLLAPDETMDTLRTGGNMRQNNMSQMDQFNFGGSLKTHWGGRADVDSYNPYLPGTGETVMFKGNQHSESDGTGKTGIGVSYGPKEHDSYTDYAEYGSEQAADVEVENGEPAAQLPDGEGGLAMTVYGALKINKHAADEIGDPKAKGLTYKKYVDRMNDKENKANRLIAKANEELQELKLRTPFDRLKFNSLEAMIKGNNEKLKDYATKKVTAAEVQNAYNETAEEYGLDASALVKGKIKASKESETAKYGKEIDQAQKGKKKKKAKTLDIKAPKPGVDEIAEPELIGKSETKQKPKEKSAEEIRAEQVANEREAGITEGPSKSKGEAEYEKLSEKDQKLYDYNLYKAILKQEERDLAKEKDPSKRLAIKQRSAQYRQFMSDKYKKDVTAIGMELNDKDDKEDSSTEDTIKAISQQLSQLLRRPLQEELDPSQIVPEMLAKAQNQLQPVQAQTYQPLLDTPFDVSFQDQLNENQATFNAIQRQLGANPAALSTLAASKYAADSKVLADQFRTNQALRTGVYSKNRDTLNDAAQKNLGILDQQYVRQQEAISKTKATDLEIAKSIADKIAKNKLENRTFAAYSNMFPQYGFNRDMMAISQNPTFFQNPMVAAAYMNQLNQTNQSDNKKDGDAKFGKRLKRQLKNGSIVKSLKSI